MSIGANIRRLREERGLTQVQLAGGVQITQSMLCQIERGTKSPTLALSAEIAKLLGCDINALIGE